ncbi:MAG: hypothetical protein ABIQ43_07370 [Sphingomonas sp.]
MTEFTATDRVALDRATVPAMRSGLARDIVAAASAGAARRLSRRDWRRHGRVLLGAGALIIASATAAATGLLDRLPIRIPGITRVVEAPGPKPKHVVRVEKPRPAPAKPTALAAVPLADPTPLPPSRQEQWRERRAARIAAGLPVRPTLVQRAIAAKLRSLPPAERQAAIAEWRRINALPPVERKIAVARVRADFLARHPKMAKRFEQRLEARNAAAADGNRPSAVGPLVTTAQPQAGTLTPDQRLERRQRWQAMNGALTPDQRAARRAWRMQRRAQRLQNGEGTPPPVR